MEINYRLMLKKVKHLKDIKRLLLQMLNSSIKEPMNVRAVN